MPSNTRRTPLANNPNIANSPVRNPQNMLNGPVKPQQKRSYATSLREDAYHQPPPLKKQMLEHATQRTSRSHPSSRATVTGQIGSGSTSTTSSVATVATPSTVAHQTAAQKAVSVSSRSRGSHSQSQQHAIEITPQERETFLHWQRQQRVRFPAYVFYFDSVPDDLRVRLVKHINGLGSREEKFFSKDVTHIITSRTIPPVDTASASRLNIQAAQHQNSHQQHEHHHGHEQTYDNENQDPNHNSTINPSLLERSTESRRKAILEIGRRIHHLNEDHGRPSPSTSKAAPAKPAPTQQDILIRAREMGKKVYSVEKLQRILANMLSNDPYEAASMCLKSGLLRVGSTQRQQPQEQSLVQMLQHEQNFGPTDRDPTAVPQDLIHFKGPHIYVYDMDEKYKPIMVREYPKVAVKTEGEWPQFRSAPNGRCPFVEDYPMDPRREQAEQEARQAKRKQLEKQKQLQQQQPKEKQQQLLKEKEKQSKSNGANTVSAKEQETTATMPITAPITRHVSVSLTKSSLATSERAMQPTSVAVTQPPQQTTTRPHISPLKAPSTLVPPSLIRAREKTALLLAKTGSLRRMGSTATNALVVAETSAPTTGQGTPSDEGHEAEDGVDEMNTDVQDYDADMNVDENDEDVDAEGEEDDMEDNVVGEGEVEEDEDATDGEEDPAAGESRPSERPMGGLMRPTDIFDPASMSHGRFRSYNLFTGRGVSGRMLAGEPVASGIQASTMTSAIQSQAISSASGVSASKAGTSKEIHGLQRKVLITRGPTGLTRQPSINSNSVLHNHTLSPTESGSRGDSASMSGRFTQIPASRAAQSQTEALTDTGAVEGATIPIAHHPSTCQDGQQHKPTHHHHHRQTQSQPQSQQSQAALDSQADKLRRQKLARIGTRSAAVAKKKQLRPGYCEPCKDTYADFDEHILTRKHRKYAEDDTNWVDVDALLARISSAGGERT